jgi:hypothetical protein
MCCLRVNAWRETLQIVDENWIIFLSVTLVTTRPSYWTFLDYIPAGDLCHYLTEAKYRPMKAI